MAPPVTLTVFDNLYDSAGNAISNAPIQCVLNSTTETTSGGLIVAKQQTTTTDGNGRFAFTLVGNDLLSPANSTYTLITPMRTYDIAPQSTNGASQQSTAANVIVNTPSALAPATSNITGNLTIAGTLTVAGLTTAQAGLTVSGGTFTISSGGFTMAGPLTLTAAASQIIPGATSFSVRDTGNANDNLLVSNAGAVTARAGLTVSAGGATITGNSTITGNLIVPFVDQRTFASPAILGGTVDWGVVNNANAVYNLRVTDAGALTVRAGLTITAGGETITAGNLTVTAGNLTFAAAASQIVPGATSLALRDNANANNNVLVSNAGAVTVRAGLSMNGSGVQVGAGALAYAQVTANQTGITAATDLTGLAVTVTVQSGRRIRVLAQVGLVQITNPALQTLTIQEGATVLSTASVNLAVSDSRTTTISAILTPTAAAHTYKLTLASSAASGQVNASATVPSYILCEDIGT